MPTRDDRVRDAGRSLALKAPCRVATTANITLSGLQTVDGVALAENDRILVRAQTDSTQNGIYTAENTAWVRAIDFDGLNDVRQGTLVWVHSGTQGTSFYVLTSADPITFGTSAITFQRWLLTAA